MIEFAGHGIAMGNAIPELKSLANHTTLTNEEDGIALYLEEVLGCNLKFPTYSFLPNVHTISRRMRHCVDCFQLNKGGFSNG